MPDHYHWEHVEGLPCKPERVSDALAHQQELKQQLQDSQDALVAAANRLSDAKTADAQARASALFNKTEAPEPTAPQAAAEVEDAQQRFSDFNAATAMANAQFISAARSAVDDWWEALSAAEPNAIELYRAAHRAFTQASNELRAIHTGKAFVDLLAKSGEVPRTAPPVPPLGADPQPWSRADEEPGEAWLKGPGFESRDKSPTMAHAGRWQPAETGRPA